MFGLKDVLFEESGADSLAGSTGLGEDLALLDNEEEAPLKPSEEQTEVKEGEEEEGKEEEEQVDETPRELAPHERPTFTDLKEYDPELFKTFPGLKDVIFRERAYTDLFTNIDDAKVALENSNALDSARDSIFTGDATAFLTSIKETDVKHLNHFAERILPALYKVDQEAHWKAANPILESMVRGFHNSAKDDDTKKAALLFAEYMFGDLAKDIIEGKKTFIPNIEKQSEEDPEKKAFRQERFNAFDSDVRLTALSGLAGMIGSKDKNGKDRLDPDGVFSPWLRKTLVEKIASEVQRQMGQDKDHMRYMDSLWDKAKKNGLQAEWKTRISDAFLARARQLVPTVRSQMVSEALGMSRKRADRTREVVKRTSHPEAGGGGRSNNGALFNPNKKINYAKSSDDDILNDNITYKE